MQGVNGPWLQCQANGSNVCRNLKWTGLTPEAEMDVPTSDHVVTGVHFRLFPQQHKSSWHKEDLGCAQLSGTDKFRGTDRMARAFLYILIASGYLQPTPL